MKNTEEWVLSAAGTRIRINSRNGEVTELSKNGNSYLIGGFCPCFDRPYTGLDAQKGWGWQEEYEKVRTQSFVLGAPQLFTGEHMAKVEIPFRQKELSAPEISGRIVYSLRGDGVVTVEADFHIDRSYQALPRVGLEGKVSEGFEALSYFGRGEVESYPDRILSAPLGVYHSTVSGQHFPFVPPSETGGHEETRWIRLEDSRKNSLLIRSKCPIHFDARHYRIENCKKAAHDHQLSRCKETILHLDAAHGPIGGDMSWSTRMPERYALTGGDYHMEVEIQLIC